ncbi:hypothetical protein AMTRI_Chr03g146020 [Amborella trichopoda]
MTKSFLFISHCTHGTPWRAIFASCLSQIGKRAFHLIYSGSPTTNIPTISSIRRTPTSISCLQNGYLQAPYIFGFLLLQHLIHLSRDFSTDVKHRLTGKACIHARSLNKLELALKDHRWDEAWEAFHDFKKLHGFPQQTLLRRMILELCYSPDARWLQRAYDLVLMVQEEKRWAFLRHDPLAMVSLSLSRAQMPVPASTVLRLMLENNSFPPKSIWSAVFLHLVKSEKGAHVASEILIEICECLSQHKISRTSGALINSLMEVYSYATVFNLVLNACLRYGSTGKAQLLLDLMAKMGISGDANSIVLMALIHERNGKRDELRKLKKHIDEVPPLLDSHYQKFYDSLLKLHFMFNDIDAASELVLDLYRRSHDLFLSRELESETKSEKSNVGTVELCKIESSKKDITIGWNSKRERSFVVHFGPRNMKTILTMRFHPEMLQDASLIKVDSTSELIIDIKGGLEASTKALARLFNGYQRLGRVDDFTKVLVSIERERPTSTEASISTQVIHACIKLGWLSTAHDIIEDMAAAGISLSTSLYLSLLRAYHIHNQWKEAKVLVKLMRKAGHLLELSDEQVISLSLSKTGAKESSPRSSRHDTLTELLERESRKEEHVSHMVYEINSSIDFFCHANMMDDAVKSFRKMQDMGLRPNKQTFRLLINGYSSLSMYREITILWGEIRRGIEDGNVQIDRDIYDSLLWSFLRGGYFERTMEFVKRMTECNMFIDKWKYKREYLKYHKDLYRNLKAAKAKTEAQLNRLEHVRAFKRWVGVKGRYPY